MDEISIAKLITHKKRLLGAQMRKLRIIRKKTKENQNTPSTSSEAKKRIRSPEEKNAAKPSLKKKNSFPLVSAAGKTGQANRKNLQKMTKTRNHKGSHSKTKTSVTVDSVTKPVVPAKETQSTFPREK